MTGATGYIGGKLALHLSRQGWIVHVLTRRPEVIKTMMRLDDTQVHAYDGRRTSLLCALRRSEPTVVFHLASMFVAEHRSDQVDDLINSNILFGTQLIDACAEVGVKNFINTGTAWQHYKSEKYQAVNLYAATKQAYENILDFYSDACKIRTVTLKLFDVYGPNDPRPKVFNILLRALKTRERLELSAGEQLLHLTHVDDVTNAYIQCATKLENITEIGSHARFAIATGDTISIKSLAAQFEEFSGTSLNTVFGVLPYRRREVMMPWRSFEKCSWWAPEIRLEDGIKSLI